MNPVVQIENLTKSFGNHVLLDNISFSIFDNMRVGLIARNGTGKTTLLKLLAGLDTPDSGNITWRGDISAGYLDQNPILDNDLTIEGNVFKGNINASEAISMYQKALLSDSKYDLAHATELMDSSNAWGLETTARQILTQLKIVNLSQSVDTLSGGQQKRVAMAATLVSQPDFLILDEPTNHLDLDMIEWLEAYLVMNKPTMLMVTHDREFLDRICTDIIEIEDKQIYWYKGNYAHFLEKREERINAQINRAERTKNIYKHELDWIRRTPSARSGKAKYRIDSFNQLREEALKHSSEKDIRINIGAARLGKKILEAVNLSKSYGELKILDNFSYNFRRFERLGIVGNNGTGKSTFLDLITGTILPDTGHIDTGETIVTGYYKQEGIAFDENSKVIDAVRDIAEVVTMGNGNKLSVSQFLTMFMFPPNVQNSYISKLSGGEKRRLYLCTVLMKSPNFLILDEPTNDLDIQTLTVLEEYLETFSGVVLAVSHDRRFLDKVVDGLLIFEGNAAISGFPGNYGDYYIWKREQHKNEARQIKQKNKDDNKTKATCRDNTKITYAEKRELETLTFEIAQLESEKKLLEEELEQSTTCYQEITKKSERIGKIIELLDTKSYRWFELIEKSESQ